MAETQTIAQLLAAHLEANGIRAVFGVPGVGNDTVYAALAEHEKGTFDLVRASDENVAGWAASGYTKASAVPGQEPMIAAITTTEGPSFSNGISAMREAYVAGVPMLVIAGTSNTERLHNRDFKRFSTKTAVHGESRFAKAVYAPSSAEEAVAMIEAAMQDLHRGRGGPVILELPRDLSLEKVEAREVGPAARPLPQSPETDAVKELAEVLMQAEKPVLVLGELVRLAGPDTQEKLKEIVELTGAVVTTPYWNRDLFDNGHPAYGGQWGLVTPQHVQDALKEADHLLVVGSWLGTETTTQGWAKPVFDQPHLTVVHPVAEDVEILSPEKLQRGQKHIAADVAPFLDVLIETLQERGAQKHTTDWQEQVHDRQRAFVEAPMDAVQHLTAPKVFRDIAAFIGENGIVTQDASYMSRAIMQADVQGTHLGGDYGHMGWTNGAALGAHIAYQHMEVERPVVGTVGDGAFDMSGLPGLVTAVNYYAQRAADGLPVFGSLSTVVVDDGGFGAAVAAAKRTGETLPTHIGDGGGRTDYADLVKAGMKEQMEVGYAGANAEERATLPGIHIAEGVLPLLEKIRAEGRKVPGFIHADVQRDF